MRSKSKVHPIWWWFVGAFALAMAGILAQQIFWSRPSAEQSCETSGGWWDPQDKVCAAPIALSTLTGRKSGSPPAPAKPAKSPGP